MAKGITLELTGLSRTVDEFRALPVAIRRAISGAVNAQATATRNEIAKRIAQDGVQARAINQRLTLKRATANTDGAEITLSRKRVPFSQMKFTTRSLDATGTRAEVYILIGGKRTKVYGFINPMGKKRQPLIRRKKGEKQILTRAGGVGLTGHWNAIVDDGYRDSVKSQLAARIQDSIGAIK